MNQYEIAFKNVINQITNNHYEKFVNHFPDLLKEQIDNFNADEFESKVHVVFFAQKEHNKSVPKCIEKR
jgi:hypothetical protein